MVTLILSVVALFLTVAIKYYAYISFSNAIALFFGLEGTVFLASALSPPHDEIETPSKKGFINWLKWWHSEGRGYRYPISYNPIFFYGGLLCLAISMSISSISN